MRSRAAKGDDDEDGIGSCMMFERFRNVYIVWSLVCCLLLILGGCSSEASGVESIAATGTEGITATAGVPYPILTPGTLAVPQSDSEIASSMVQGMTLEQKLGQMVIVEFYGSTLNGDLMQMIEGNQVGGVLIENKNGNAQTRNQLITLNRGMQAEAHIPLFISTDFE